MKISINLAGWLLCQGLVLSAVGTADAKTAAICPGPSVDRKSHVSLADGKPNPDMHPPSSSCHTQIKNGYPVPDASCTPGAANATLTTDVLHAPGFSTDCMRDKATTGDDKDNTYDWYGITKPSNNQGVYQICELDHLVSLELGGADTLENIWPQCGPDAVTLNRRYFKIKDQVEDYLAMRVRACHMELHDAQTAIAADWTQFLSKAQAACRGTSCKPDC